MTKIVVPRREIVLPNRRRQEGFLRLPLGVGRWGRDRYSVEAADFDGTNDYGTRGALTSVSDHKDGTMSFWIYKDSSTFMNIFYGAENFGGGDGDYNNLKCISDANNMVRIGATDGLSDDIFALQSTNSALSTGSWHHVLFQWSRTTGTYNVYVDDSNVKSFGNQNVNEAVHYAQMDFVRVGAPALSTTSKLNGGLAELWLCANQALDITSQAVRRLFRTEAGRPQWLGDYGEIPLGGVKPAVYLSLRRGQGRGAPTFYTNRGFGGSFTEVGALTYRSDSPSY